MLMDRPKATGSRLHEESKLVRRAAQYIHAFNYTCEHFRVFEGHG